MLVQVIADAFAGLNPPSDDQLLHPDCMDDVDIAPFYGGSRWQDVPSEMVVYNYAAPFSFSPEAFQYYLPTYLIWTLNHPDSAEIAGESILRALNPGDAQDQLYTFRKSKFTLLTRAQIGVVKKFLCQMSGHQELGQFADAALSNFWWDA